jgi:hypothetical protein
MNDLRCDARLMQLTESTAMLRHFEYPTTWPVSDLLHEKFFTTHPRLQAGDKITICRFNTKNFNEATAKLLEIGDVRVLEVKNREYVNLGLVGEILYFGERANADGGSIDRLHVQRGQSGKFKLMSGDTEMEVFGSKAEADAALLRIAA